MLTAASIFVSPSLAYREIYSFHFCSPQVHRVGRVRIENSPNCHKRLNPVYPQVCTDSGKELKAGGHSCVQKHSHFQKRKRSGERGIFCDKGWWFLLPHLSPSGPRSIQVGLFREAGPWNSYCYVCVVLPRAAVLPFEYAYESLGGRPWWLRSKESTCQSRTHRDVGSVPGSGRLPGEDHGNPLLYFCLDNPMDRGAWQAIVHGVAKSQTLLSDRTQHSNL